MNAAHTRHPSMQHLLLLYNPSRCEWQSVSWRLSGRESASALSMAGDDRAGRRQGEWSGQEWRGQEW
ncbi:hypothetical protein BKA93DRAFT_790771 [Sparassis latifolia]